MNESEIRGRIAWHLLEQMPAHLSAYQNSMKEDDYTNEERIALAEEYERWQLSPDPTVINTTEISLFVQGLRWLIDQLNANFTDASSDEEIQAVFYEAAKRSFGEEKSSIRNFFRYLYLVLFGTESGPRWSQFVRAMSMQRFLQVLEERTESLR